MELWEQDEELLETLESEARYKEYSQILGILKVCKAGQQSEENLIRIISEQEKWPPTTVRRIIDQLQEVGWVKLFEFKVVKLIPTENRNKKD